MTADAVHVTGGVDTHADVHVAAALNCATGKLIGTASFPTTPPVHALVRVARVARNNNR